MRHFLIASSILALSACGLNGTDKDEDQQQTEAAATAEPDNLADSMASHDGEDSQDLALDIPDSEDRPVMQAQVVLDRQGFGPGVIDGKMGMSTENALRGFQQASGLDETGQLDEATKAKLSQWETIPATRVVRIPADWGTAQYKEIPDDTADQAEMKRLGYESLDERLAERFHTTIETLHALNPGGRPAGDTVPQPQSSGVAHAPPTKRPGDSMFAGGQIIRVPNIGADKIAPGSVSDASWQQTLASLGVGSDQPKLDRIVVSKLGKTLKGYQGNKLAVLFTVSSGSSEFPLPLGEWKIVGEAYNPPFNYDPKVLQGDESAKGKEYTLPPGPNGPVGVVWIDLSKPHYGIHGTPEPQTIGRAQSHGCVRLTNWDAARLAQMVSPKTSVEFVK